MTGYVINFKGHGSFSPTGKVEMTEAQIAEHNRELAVAEIEHAKQTGRAIFYLYRSVTAPNGLKRDHVGTWEGSQKFMVCNQNTSRHNMAGKRLDLWFVGPDGKTWHGVNIGDNDIVRCHRLKAQ